MTVSACPIRFTVEFEREEIEQLRVILESGKRHYEHLFEEGSMGSYHFSRVQEMRSELRIIDQMLGKL